MLLNTLHIIFKGSGRIWLYLCLLCLPVVAAAQDYEETVVDTIVSPPVADVETYEAATPELRAVPDSTVERLKRDERFAYANDPEYWSKIKKEEEKQEDSERSKGFWNSVDNMLSSGTASTIFYIILGVICVLIIYRIVVVNNLYSGSRRRKEDTEVLPESEIDDNNLDQRVQAAILANDYRLAVRYMYLKTLRSLNDKGWIRYHAKATNNEYITQVHHYGVGNEFRFLTHVYEYVWYGEFALSVQQFERVQQDFNRFFNTAKL
jgi:hypothetical protein